MLQVFMVICTVIILLELFCLMHATLKPSQTKQPFLIDRKELKKVLSFRKVILNQVFAHYMTVDASVGYRTKANCAPFRLLKRLPGNKKRFKEVKVKNFFEIRTDNQGFIANTPDQTRNYADIIKDDSVFKIVVVGASVSAGYGTKSGEFAWPALLEQKIKENLSPNFSSAVVINSSILGSRLSQDAKRLQDELLFLNPHLVISYGGGDTEYKYVGNPVDLSYSDPQKALNERANNTLIARQKIFLPNLFSLLRSRHTVNQNKYPFRNENYIKISAAEYGLAKIKQMKGLCDAHNVPFLFFLQPGMGVGHKQYSKQEKNLITYFERYFFEMNWEEYVSSLEHYFSELRPSLIETYQHDLMNLFDPIEDTLYADPRHPNEKGHQIIAEHIYTVVNSTVNYSENVNKVAAA